MRLLLCVALYVILHSSNAVSTKLDFGEDPPTYFNEEPTFVVNKNNSNTEDEDVEVQHTIVVSTKLKNNNRRGITSNGDADGTLSFTIDQSPRNKAKDDSGEVPVIKSFKSVETTDIKTPDTRYKTKIYPDSIFVNRNIRDEADMFPNVIAYPLGWKPASFYNNINYKDQNAGQNYFSPSDPYNIARRRNPNQGQIHRKTSDEGMKDFYCRKCAELSTRHGIKGCGIQQRSANIPSANSWYETTTAKMKIDGKLAKLN